MRPLNYIFYGSLLGFFNGIVLGAIFCPKYLPLCIILSTIIGILIFSNVSSLRWCYLTLSVVNILAFMFSFVLTGTIANPIFKGLYCLCLILFGLGFLKVNQKS